MGSVTGGAIDLDRQWTLAELDELPEDARRFELADGVLRVSPMARRRHQVGATELGGVLERACPPTCCCCNPPRRAGCRA